VETRHRFGRHRLLLLRYSRFPLNRLHFVWPRLNWKIKPDHESTNFRPRESRTNRRPSHLIGRFLQNQTTMMARAKRMRRAEISPVVRKDCGVQCRTLRSITRIMCFMTPKSNALLRCKFQVTRSSTTVTEPEVIQVKLKRCSLWKRTKKFARRVFCCAAWW